MHTNTLYDFLSLQMAAPDRGIFLEGLVVLPIAFIGLVFATIIGSTAVKSRVKDFSPVWAMAIATVSAVIVSASVRVLLSIPPLEVEVVTMSSTLLFPLGLAVRRRNILLSGLIGASFLVLIYSAGYVFPNTKNEVIPLILGSGLVFLAIGYKIDD